MSQSPYQQASQQHLRLTQQHDNQNQHRVNNAWQAEAQLQAHIQQALLSVQHLEQQRLSSVTNQGPY